MLNLIAWLDFEFKFNQKIFFPESVNHAKEHFVFIFFVTLFSLFITLFNTLNTVRFCISNNFFCLQKANCLVMEHIKINTSICDTAVKERRFFDILRFRKKPSLNLSVPNIIYQNCSGITLNNTVVKSILFSTDLAVIENTNCDAILAVYPFAPSVNIMKALISFTEKPVICGVGGGVTQGRFSLDMAVAAEQLGASAVIVNQPFKNSDLKKIQKLINIPIIASVSNVDFSFIERFHSGTNIFHITGGANTPEVI